MSTVSHTLSRRQVWTVGAVAAGIAAVYLAAALFPTSFADDLWSILSSQSTHQATLRIAVPISLAAVGGIFAEKSGVINIGIEGLLIVSAFSAIIATIVLGSGQATAGVPNRWWGLIVGTLASTLFALVFAVVCIDFEADQIIAGLAVWLIALGLAPFVSRVLFTGPNTDTLDATFSNVTVPGLSAIPIVGDLLFNTNPAVWLMLGSTALGWYLLTQTRFGRWVRASGENPKALDTAGVSVRRVRYAAVVLSGVFAGLGGAGFAIGQLGTFGGSGQTDIGGRGFIAIATYLFANYNPIGALGGSLLFAGFDAMQFRLQNVGYAVPTELIRTIPYVTVIVVLVFVGKTQIPSSVGENYKSGED